VGFKPEILMLERERAIRVLVRSNTVFGLKIISTYKYALRKKKKEFKSAKLGSTCTNY
jgi:hypothetical protein